MTNKQNKTAQELALEWIKDNCNFQDGGKQLEFIRCVNALTPPSDDA